MLVPEDGHGDSQDRAKLRRQTTGLGYEPAQEALKGKENWLSLIFHGVSDLFFVIGVEPGPQFRCLVVNHSYLKGTGRTQEQMEGKLIEEILPPEEARVVIGNYLNALLSRRPTTYEESADVPARRLVVETTLTPVFDAQGSCTHLLGASRDITGRKRIESALRESEQRYRAVVETQTELICRFLPDTTLTFVNEAYCRYFGKSRQELLGTSFLPLIPEHARPAARAHIESLIASPRLIANEHEVIAAGGELRWQRWTDQAIVDDSGRLIEFQSTGLDVTERKRVEEQLRESEARLRLLQSELAHINRAITMGEMAASIAHEVNQPLGAIVGNADICLRWLADKTPDLDRVREALSDIVKDGHRASEVIDRVRTLVRKGTQQKISFDINQAVREAVTLIIHEAQRKRVTLRLELAADLPPVLGDRVQLGQVLLNLMMNGIEAMSEVEGRERELVIRSGRGEAGGVRVAVQDCGVGIDPREAKRLFAPFYTTKPEGMGMGLAICRSIVEAHGGRLWAVSNVGPGATLHFTLPSGCEAGR